MGVSLVQAIRKKTTPIKMNNEQLKHTVSLFIVFLIFTTFLLVLPLGPENKKPPSGNSTFGGPTYNQNILQTSFIGVFPS
jgi:hypothetical protein